VDSESIFCILAQISRNDDILEPLEVARLIGIYELNRKYKVDVAELFKLVAMHEKEGHDLSKALELTRKGLAELFKLVAMHEKEGHDLSKVLELTRIRFP
jgi:hypothetical protein